MPVILITDKKFFNIKKEYKKFYNQLINCNVIFFDKIKAANFVKDNINNIDTWWFHKNTQKNKIFL